jgi:class 3 adenylate cyclase
MNCLQCKHDNPQGSRFCLRCGRAIELFCPECGHPLPPSAQFCSGCGHDVQKTNSPATDCSRPHSYTPPFLFQEILTTRSAIEGERKIVTVLFADVAHYTGISSRLEPEQVHEILNGCFKILMDEIHKYEGTINQFTGDGVMALFGAPLAHEDHAQRACYAALAIQQGLESYAERMRVDYGIEFHMRIGLNSGPVVVGVIGDDLRMDYTAVGDTTNLAFRVQGLAEAGTTCVSEETYRLTKGMFQFEALDKKRVKGKSEAVSVYKLLSLRPEVQRPRPGAERTIYSKMVGRDRQLEKLELQVLKAVNGQGSVVNIIGEAGIGKSRLVAELKGRETMKRVNLLEGRAISIGRNLSFHPIIDLLKQWMKIRENEDPEAAFDKLRRAVRSVAPEEAGDAVPFVATLMGIPLWGKYAERVRGLEGEALEKLILKSLRGLLVRAAERTTLVIIMEDLHWADTSSIELLESLFRLSETQRILFLNLFRPGFPETGERILKTLKERLPVYYLEMVLEPLDEQLSEALIGNMLAIW